MVAKAPRPASAPDTYWVSFGLFISHYASVEWQLNRLVRHYYKLPPKTANIALGQLRYDTAIEHLERLRIAGQIPEDEAE
jgi:hypothetical protein